MTYNFVSVTITAADPFGNAALAGATLTFTPSDFIWDTASNGLVVVSPLQFTATGGDWQKGAQVSLMAMDNPTLSKNWTWLLLGSVEGLPPIPPRALTVAYANGPTQSLGALLATSTVV